MGSKRTAQNTRFMAKRSSDKWEEQFTEFNAYDGMPAVGTKSFYWQKTHLSSGPKGLNSKIEKESESNEGGTVWRDRKVRLKDCIASKKSA